MTIIGTQSDDRKEDKTVFDEILKILSEVHAISDINNRLADFTTDKTVFDDASTWLNTRIL